MGKDQDPGSGINIPDPQHCMFALPDLDTDLLACLNPDPDLKHCWNRYDSYSDC